MLKRTFLSVGLITFFTILFLGYKINKKLAAKKETAFKSQTLPSVRLLTLDSITFQFPLHSSIVLIHFNTSCEHCQYELRKIKKNISSFTKGQVILMSSENISDI